VLAGVSGAYNYYAFLDIKLYFAVCQYLCCFHDGVRWPVVLDRPDTAVGTFARVPHTLLSQVGDVLMGGLLHSSSSLRLLILAYAIPHMSSTAAEAASMVVPVKVR